VEWVDQLKVHCIGTNRFGSSAKKTFILQVTKRKEQPEGTVDKDTSGLSNVIIVVIVLGLLFIALSCGASFFLYFKFRKFGRAIVSMLTDEEVKDFREGKEEAVSPHHESAAVKHEGNSNGVYGGQLAIDYLPYNPEFEVSREKLIVGKYHKYKQVCKN
jgi:hypothetical protein